MTSSRDLKFYREVSRRISSDLDIGEALNATFQYLRGFLPIKFVFMGYYDLASEGAYIVALASKEGAVPTPSATTPIFRKASDEFLCEYNDLLRNDEFMNNVTIVRPGDPRIQTRPNDLENEVPPMLRNHLSRGSALFARLIISGELVGMLMLAYEEGIAPTTEQRNLLAGVLEPIAIAASNARRYHDVVRLKDKLADDYRVAHADLERLTGNDVIGADLGLRHVMELTHQVASTTSPVLLLGETGTGKEVIANALHESSPRRERPMIRVHCGGLPESLLDSELFGYEKGAFTGAVAARRGRFERAQGGTIFLDEIGELSMNAQVKLLRVLQEREFERVGGSETITADVRIIAATHRNLEAMVRGGRFREDLWYRVNVFPIWIPPLRERREDIPDLVHHFIHRKAREMNLGRRPVVRPDGMERLQAYAWPGNVRELQNVIERALIVNSGPFLEIPWLVSTPVNQPGESPFSPTPVSRVGEAPPDNGDATLDDVVAFSIREALARAHGRVQGADGAAARLGINPSTLRARMRKLGIAFGRKAR